MTVRHICPWCRVAALATLGAIVGLHKATAVPPGPTDAADGIQVLTRGPVHEAFAETVTFDPQPGIVAPKAPPAAIEELPPDQKPEGANIAWIPGYWAWDDERSDFLWVSGIWRDLPPSRQWVPGYWDQSGQGYQWTSGYWADAQASNVQYLPEPPVTAEAGPNIPSPSPDDTWLPGSWLWQQNRYAWRPGLWATAHPDWEWVPAHYLWAHRGYVFVDGYWDYSIGRRGVLFAPVYFSAGMYTQPRFSYSPATVIDLDVFTNCLFLRPQYQHYYFGDYYADNYQAAGFYPSYSYNSGRHGYDPIFTHERWQHRQDGQWERRIAADFQNRRDHADARPPRTLAAQTAFRAGEATSGKRSPVLAVPFSQFTKSQNSPLRFQPVDSLERQKLVQHVQAVQRFREQRQKLENQAAAPSAASAARQFAPANGRLPTSPIATRSNTELGKDHVPPQMHVAPKPDLTVEAKPRATPSLEKPQQRTVNRLPLDTPKPEPRAERPAPKAEPRVERPAPKAEPPVERPAPKPEPQVERPAPKPEPQVERPAPKPPAERPAAGPNRNGQKEKGK